MCYAWVPYAIMAVTAAAKSYGDYEQGKYEEGVSKYNARASENDATRVRNKGVEEENKLRRQTAELIGSQRASAAAFGVDVDKGSAFQLQQDSALLGEVDALRVRSNFEQQAKGLDDTAKSELARGKNARKQGRNSLLTGALTVASFGASGYNAQMGANAEAAAKASASSETVTSTGTSVNPSWYNSNSAARSTRSTIYG